jgi:hypothetical protein
MVAEFKEVLGTVIHGDGSGATLISLPLLLLLLLLLDEEESSTTGKGS